MNKLIPEDMFGIKAELARKKRIHEKLRTGRKLSVSDNEQIEIPLENPLLVVLVILFLFLFAMAQFFSAYDVKNDSYNVFNYLKNLDDQNQILGSDKTLDEIMKSNGFLENHIEVQKLDGDDQENIVLWSNSSCSSSSVNESIRIIGIPYDSGNPNRRFLNAFLQIAVDFIQLQNCNGSYDPEDNHINDLMNSSMEERNSIFAFVFFDSASSAVEKSVNSFVEYVRGEISYVLMITEEDAERDLLLLETKFGNYVTPRWLMNRFFICDGCSGIGTKNPFLSSLYQTIKSPEGFVDFKYDSHLIRCGVNSMRKGIPFASLRALHNNDNENDKPFLDLLRCFLTLTSDVNDEFKSPNFFSQIYIGFPGISFGFWEILFLSCLMISWIILSTFKEYLGNENRSFLGKSFFWTHMIIVFLQILFFDTVFVFLCFFWVFISFVSVKTTKYASGILINLFCLISIGGFLFGNYYIYNQPQNANFSEVIQVFLFWSQSFISLGYSVFFFLKNEKEKENEKKEVKEKEKKKKKK